MSRFNFLLDVPLPNHVVLAEDAQPNRSPLVLTGKVELLDKGSRLFDVATQAIFLVTKKPECDTAVSVILFQHTGAKKSDSKKGNHLFMLPPAFYMEKI